LGSRALHAATHWSIEHLYDYRSRALHAATHWSIEHLYDYQLCA